MNGEITCFIVITRFLKKEVTVYVVSRNSIATGSVESCLLILLSIV